MQHEAHWEHNNKVASLSMVKESVVGQQKKIWQIKFILSYLILCST